MKRRSIRLRSVIIGICLIFMLGINVLAMNEAMIAGVYTNEGDISLYVKGLDSEISDVTCQIGTRKGQNVVFEDVINMEKPPRTLIMIDNSLSITASNREKINSFLMAFLDDKADREQIAIAVFDEEVKEVIDYTSDVQALKEAVQSISYQNQDTYLTDMLYDVLKKEHLGTEDCYKKIIIISDGVDNKPIGYTKDELYALIKERSYPIYALGCIYGNNEEQLKNMFAVSRMTGGLNFCLDEVENVEMVADEILRDCRAVHFNIAPAAEEMDGSIKNVLLTVQTANEEQKIEVSVKMPVRAEEPEEISEPVEEEIIETEQEEQHKMTVFPILYIVIIVAAVSAIAIIISRKKKRNPYDNLPPAILPPDSDETVRMDGDDQTLMLDGQPQMSGRGAPTLYLTDEQNLSRTFQAPLQGTIVIGKKMGEANLLIDNDKSISGKHCRISEKNGKYYVEDLHSTNGTKLNGHFIQREAEIYTGCILTIGRSNMKVEIR